MILTLFKNTKIQNDFKCFWVDVTRHYKEEDLLEDLAVKVTNRDRGDFEKKNRDDLGTLLRKSLERVKYLIVLDDMWDSSAWTIFDKFLPKDEVGAKVLITTRFNRVAETADPLTPPHRPDKLNEEKSWELFLRTCDCSGGVRGDWKENGREMWGLAPCYTGAWWFAIQTKINWSMEKARGDPHLEIRKRDWKLHENLGVEL